MSKSNPVRRSLVSLAGVGGAVVAAVVVALAVTVPVPALTLGAASVSVDPTPAAQTRICPGGLIDITSRSGDATVFQSFAAPDITADALRTSITQTPLPAPDNAATNPDFGPRVLTSEPSPDVKAPALAAGSQSQSTAADSISGLAATACSEASTDQWLVGGSTEVGRNTLLLLSNALNVDATVSLEIFGEKGRVEAPGMTALLVKAKSQRILSLASFAPGVADPVVHVMTTGGQVLATLQQTVTRVVTPSGVDLIQAGAAPATTQIIPGVALTGMAGQDSEGGAVTSDLAPAIRVLLPGARDAEVTATVISATTKPVVIKAKFTAGRVLQLPFLGVIDGIYTVVVTADAPLVAGVRTIQSPNNPIAPETAATPAPAPTATATASASASAGASAAPAPVGGVDAGDELGGPASGGGPTVPGGDFAWNASALALSAQTLVAVPAGGHPTLTLFNPTATAQTVRFGVINGSADSVGVPAGGSVVVSVATAGVLSLTDGLGLYATVTLRDVGRGAAFTVPPASRLSSAITVYPR